MYRNPQDASGVRREIMLVEIQETPSTAPEGDDHRCDENERDATVHDVEDEVLYPFPVTKR